MADKEVWGPGLSHITSPASGDRMPIATGSGAGGYSERGEFAWKNADGKFSVDGYFGVLVSDPDVAFELQTNDQTTCRVRLDNVGVGGEKWDIVAGLHNVSQGGFSFHNVTQNFTELYLQNGNATFFTPDSAEGGLKLSKESGPSAGARIDWIFSHRENNKDLLLYGYDGSTFKNFLKFDWSNDRFESHRNFTPGTDNALMNGTGSLRWSVIYAASGTINTSDRRDKTAIRAFTDAEMAAAKRIAAEIGIFQFLTGARDHVGVIAQDVWAIMADEGLVEPITEGATPSSSYAFLCYDEWEEFALGEPAPVVRSRFGIRPDQLALFLIAAQEARIAALEAA